MKSDELQISLSVSCRKVILLKTTPSLYLSGLERHLESLFRTCYGAAKKKT